MLGIIKTMSPCRTTEYVSQSELSCRTTSTLLTMPWSFTPNKGIATTIHEWRAVAPGDTNTVLVVEISKWTSRGN